MPDDREDLLAEMLEDFAELSGIDMGELLADVPEDYTPDFIEFEIGEEPERGEDFTLDNDYSTNADEYFDSLMDDLDIDAAEEEDSYSRDER